MNLDDYRVNHCHRQLRRRTASDVLADALFRFVFEPIYAYRLPLALAALTAFMLGVREARAEKLHGDFGLNVWQLSHHLEDAPYGEHFTEANPGLGVRYYVPTSIDRMEAFASVDYIWKNSTGGDLFTVGVGAQYPLTTVGSVEVLAGAAIGVSYYENQWERRSYVSPNGYPFIALRYGNATATLGYIPRVRSGNKHTYPTLFMYLSL